MSTIQIIYSYEEHYSDETPRIGVPQEIASNLIYPEAYQGVVGCFCHMTHDGVAMQDHFNM